jgi:hypothetical protein
LYNRYFIKKVICLLNCILQTSACIANTTEQKQCQDNQVEYSVAKEFAQSLKVALAKDDKDFIADKVSYPLRIHSQTNKKQHFYLIAHKEDFLKRYSMLFPQAIKTRIIKDNTLFCNYQGAMLGNGAIWFETQPKPKIYVINQLLG